MFAKKKLGGISLMLAAVGWIGTTSAQTTHDVMAQGTIFSPSRAKMRSRSLIPMR